MLRHLPALIVLASASLAMAEPEAAKAPASQPASPTSQPASATTRSSPPVSQATPKEALELYMRATAAVVPPEKLVDLIITTTEEQKSMVHSNAQYIAAEAAFAGAVIHKFGKHAYNEAYEEEHLKDDRKQLRDRLDVVNETPATITGEKAVIAIPGWETPFEFRKIDGKWKMTYESWAKYETGDEPALPPAYHLDEWKLAAQNLMATVKEVESGQFKSIDIAEESLQKRHEATAKMLNKKHNIKEE